MRTINRRGLLAMTLFSTLSSEMSPVKADKHRFTDIAKFRELVIAAFKGEPAVVSAVADPSDPAKLTIKIGDSSSHGIEINVSNIFGYSNAHPDENVDQIIHRFVQAGIAARTKRSVSDSNIVPIVRDREYVEYLKKTTNFDIPYEPLGAELTVVYMADLPDLLSTLTPTDVPGKDLQALRQIALNNVRQWLPRVISNDRSQTGVIYSVDENELLSPSLILLDEFWKSIEAKFPGDVLIALPRRDRLFIFDARNPESEPAARRLIDATTRETSNLLSNKLFARRSGEIVLVPS